MTVQIDHVVIAGSDLAQLCNAFTSIGLTPDEGGVHADGQTHNALIGFADGSYLELIAPTPGNTAANHPWAEFMRTNAGVCAWAIRSADIQADVALYRSRGIEVGDPTPGGRIRPDGVRLEWITAKLGTETLGSVLPFLIQDVTPREWRAPRTKSAEGLIIGISEVEICENLSTTHEGLTNLFHRAFVLPDTLSNSISSDLQIRFCTVFGDHSVPRIHGLVLNTNNLDMARTRYHTLDRVRRRRVRANPGTTWLSFDGPMISTFDLGRFRRQLAETIAWCTPRALDANFKDSLRSFGVWFPTHTGYNQLFEMRAQSLKANGIQIPPLEHNMAGGQLIVYNANDCLSEGAMYLESNGYFGQFDDEPPCDTWVYFDPVEELLICWVPPSLIDQVERGMKVMTLDWCWWLTGDQDYNFAEVLKREGFLG